VSGQYLFALVHFNKKHIASFQASEGKGKGVVIAALDSNEINQQVYWARQFVFVLF